jgi:hypothetical protein
MSQKFIYTEFDTTTLEEIEALGERLERAVERSLARRDVLSQLARQRSNVARQIACAGPLKRLEVYP